MANPLLKRLLGENNVNSAEGAEFDQHAYDAALKEIADDYVRERVKGFPGHPAISREEALRKWENVKPSFEAALKKDSPEARRLRIWKAKNPAGREYPELPPPKLGASSVELDAQSYKRSQAAEEKREVQIARAILAKVNKLKSGWPPGNGFNEIEALANELISIHGGVPS